jgi:hypothetical protein
MRNRDPHVPDNDDALLDRGIIRKSVHAFITSAIREPESNQATAEPFR